MPADAINYGKLAEELHGKLSDGRIDKIIMSDKTTLVLRIRARGKNNDLLVTAAASPRCFLTANAPKGTDVPLSFCLHLRKHIGGGVISAVERCPSNGYSRSAYAREAISASRWHTRCTSRSWASTPTSCSPTVRER